MQLNATYDQGENKIAVSPNVFQKLLENYINNGKNEELVVSCKEFYEFFSSVGVNK